MINNAIVPKPYILDRKCVKCGICVRMCPMDPKVVNWHDGDKNRAPSYRYERCISCYYCQEVCPEGAIQVKVPWVRRIIQRKNT